MIAKSNDLVVHGMAMCDNCYFIVFYVPPFSEEFWDSYKICIKGKI